MLQEWCGTSASEWQIGQLLSVLGMLRGCQLSIFDRESDRVSGIASDSMSTRVKDCATASDIVTQIDRARVGASDSDSL